MGRILNSETAYPHTALVVFVFLVFGILRCAPVLGSDARGGAPQPQFSVGYHVLDLKYPKDGQEQTLTVAVWYPTTAQPKSYHYGGAISGHVAVDASPHDKDGPYPFLIFSHGYGGGGLSAAFLSEALAARGWIVACPDHHDKHSAIRIRTGQEKDFDRLGLLRHAKEIATSGPNDRSRYLYRLDEMRLVLEGMLTSDPFGKLIDSNRIAVGGHSFGGFTALGLSGTIEEYHDPRIKAILLFSTGAGGYLFRKEELAAVRIPCMLFIGDQEKDQLRGPETMSELAEKIYRNIAPPKYFLEVKGANHFSFNNRFADNWRTRMLRDTEDQFEVIRRYSIAFLEKHVAGREDPACMLERGHPLLTRYVSEPVPDAAKQKAEAPGERKQRAEQDAPAAPDKPRR